MGVFDDIQSELSPHEKSVVLCLDGALLSEIAQLEQELFAIGSGDTIEGEPRAIELAQQILDLKAKAESKERTFRFRQVTQSEWSDLQAKHPATKEQRERNGFLAAWNPKTFPPAAIALCSVEPELSAEQAKWLWENLSSAQAEKLWAACRDLNLRDVELGKDGSAIEALRRIAQSSTTAALEESREPSSSDV